MRNQLVHVAWTAAPLSAEQQMVLRHLAAMFLRREDLKQDSIGFTHELIEGRLTRKSKGVFVTMAGTFFHADLGSVRGVRWTIDFLLPAGSEHLVFDDTSHTIARRVDPDGSYHVFEIDRALSAVSEVSLLG